MVRPWQAGKKIGSYELTTDGKFAGSGTAQWAFASKDGKEYFIKQFISPVYPLPEAPGTAKGKEERLRECQRFEERIRRVEAALMCMKDGGFLVKAEDFFRVEGFFYKITDRVDMASVDVSKLSVEKQQLVLRSVTYQLAALHKVDGFVHADLKPDNIIIRAFKENFVARVIDFDSSFFETDLPLPKDVIGDQVYQAPEMLEYLLEKPSVRPGQPIDVFALGLIFSEYVFGKLPTFPACHSCAGEALLNGATLDVPFRTDGASAFVADMVASMLARDPGARPTTQGVFDALKGNKWPPMATSSVPVTKVSATASPPARSSLRKGRRLEPPMATPVVVEEPSDRPGVCDVRVAGVPVSRVRKRGEVEASPESRGASKAPTAERELPAEPITSGSGPLAVPSIPKSRVRSRKA